MSQTGYARPTVKATTQSRPGRNHRPHCWKHRRSERAGKALYLRAFCKKPQSGLFWVNNNYDRWDVDILSATNEQDDVKLPGGQGYPNTLTPECNPDCNYILANGYAYRAIPCTRDLEDYARLWVCGVTTNLLARLPTGSTVTLSWGDVGNPNPSNPTIDMFPSCRLRRWYRLFDERNHRH